jgi:hypothetical protein
LGDKKTLSLTYKDLVKHVMLFNGPIWYARVEPCASSIKRLKRVKNASMRLITEAHKMSSQDHLQAETGFLPVSEQLGLICLKFLVCAYREEHPFHRVIHLPTGRGRKGIIHTLQSRFDHVMQPYLTNGVLLPLNYKKTIKAINTSVVAANKHSLKNKIHLRLTPRRNPSSSHQNSSLST